MEVCVFTCVWECQCVYVCQCVSMSTLVGLVLFYVSMCLGVS